MSTNTNYQAQRAISSKFVGLLVIGSGCWSLLVIVISGLYVSGVLDWLLGQVDRSSLPPFEFLIASSGGPLVLALVVVLIHTLVLFVAHSSARGLLLATGGMFLISFLTGFTVGLYLLPSVVVLLLAAIVAISSPRSTPS